MANVFVITGPSGVGKGTLIARLQADRPGIELSMSATTRPARQGERDGRDYIFLTPDEFQEKVDSCLFLEHAEYIGYRYGTLKSQIDERLRRDKSVVLEIEIQGARQIREVMPDAVLIFIKPPSLAELRDRLEDRHTDTAEQIEARMATAVEELRAEDLFEDVVVNDVLDTAVEELLKIVDRRR